MISSHPHTQSQGRFHRFYFLVCYESSPTKHVTLNNYTCISENLSSILAQKVACSLSRRSLHLRLFLLSYTKFGMVYTHCKSKCIVLRNHIHCSHTAYLFSVRLSHVFCQVCLLSQFERLKFIILPYRQSFTLFAHCTVRTMLSLALCICLFEVTKLCHAVSFLRHVPSYLSIPSNFIRVCVCGCVFGILCTIHILSWVPLKISLQA